MEKIDEHFLKTLDKGGRIFKYNKHSNGEDYLLYTVEKKLDKDNFELMNVFDKKEKTITIRAEQIIKEDCWFFNPSF